MTTCGRWQQLSPPSVPTMTDLDDLISRVERLTGTPDDALAEAVCHALMFDGRGHGCGACCMAQFNFRTEGKDGVLALLRAIRSQAGERGRG